MTGSINISAVADTARSSENASKSDGWKRANRKYKSKRSDLVKQSMSKFTERCTGLSGFIYDLGPNQTNEYINTKIKTKEYEGQAYGAEARKAINELDRKLSAFKKTEDLTLDYKILLMHTKHYKLKIWHWFNMRNTYKQVMEVIYSIIYGKCTNITKQKLENFTEF